MAQVKTLIRSQAQHIRIVSLAAGDVYKRIIPPDNYNKAKVVFGVVTDVLVNDETTALICVEYEVTSYSDVDAKIVTHTETDDVAVFPAHPEEVRVYFTEVAEAQERKVAGKSRELVDAKRKLEAVERVLSSDLTTPQIEQASE